MIIPCEFAADVVTKTLNRNDSLEDSAMEAVLCLYWSSFPCKGDGLTPGRAKLHQPVLFPLLETVKVGLECADVMHSLDGMEQQTVTQQTSALWDKRYLKQSLLFLLCKQIITAISSRKLVSGLANSVWCPYKIGDLKEIEKIQKRATKLVIKLKNKSYVDRLIYLNLPTLKYRRLEGDTIEVFKITHNIYDTRVSPDLPFNERAKHRRQQLYITK